MEGKIRPQGFARSHKIEPTPSIRKPACLGLVVLAGTAVLLCNMLLMWWVYPKAALLPSGCGKALQQLQQQQLMLPGMPIDETSPLGLTTDAPMITLPPYEPTCIFKHLTQLDDIGCPVLQCSKSPFCSVHDPRCCAYFNHQMLIFLADYLESKCLEDQYYLVFGSALGAFREHSILLHTDDLDFGATPLLLQFLELNSTRSDLWKHGYVFFHFMQSSSLGKAYFKMCPHRHHPSPHFQAAMLNVSVADWSNRQLEQLSVYADFWPLWPAQHSRWACMEETDTDWDAVLETPWDAEFREGSDPRPDLCSSRKVSEHWKLLGHVQQGDDSLSDAAADATEPNHGSERWCLFRAVEAFYPGVVRVENRLYPTVGEPERHLISEFGPHWRIPKPGDHGTFTDNPDIWELNDALTRKLSVTAWGGMPYPERWARCKALENEARVEAV